MAATQYKKHTHREHILELPDTYIGSVETTEEFRWVYNATAQPQPKMVHRRVRFNPGLYKIYDEVLVNARDAFIRSSEPGKTPVKQISITCEDSPEGFRVMVENDGDGIPVELHPTEKVYAPELIFGHLLTSGNYNKEEEKIVGGKNGYGSKLANIFSKRFAVSVKDPVRGLSYSQVWRDNMSVCEKPSVKKGGASKGSVTVAFVPDLARFHGASTDGETVSEDMRAVLHTRALELAALVGKDCKVVYNGTPCAANTFEKFVRLFLPASTSVAYERCGPRWEIAAVLSRDLYGDESVGAEEKHISFVNGINTRLGGKHVEYVSKHILGELCEVAQKKRKLDIKPGQIKDTVVFFVAATIVNPSFASQTKETLTTTASKFGSTPFTGTTPGAKIVEGLIKAGVLDEAQAIADAKAAKDAKKSDGSKRRTIRGLPKLEDALWAGTAKSSECTLILTEGDSAATSAIAGLKVVGREAWGVFPLRGKLLNVRDVSTKKAAENKELTEIKKILGLEHGRKYKDVKDLRYGRVMIMSDQDVDGFHIRGLLMNLFHTEWPSLMKLASGFICCLITPLLKTTKGSKTLAFYSESEYEGWKATAEGSASGWKTKYYKGLGTSTPAEAREWFEQLNDIKYIYDENTDGSMELAFSKSKADERKQWLSKYNQKLFLDPKGRHVSYTEFVNKELIHFSNADNIRSIPNVMDGLKPSQRKILWSALKRNLRSEIRVAQLAGYVSEHAAYHHGETSLTGAITAMAQTFVGSNNINLLVPVGQFGSRLQGGKDAASPRYIQTYLEQIVDTIYKKEDSAILNYTDDDGVKVEPETYLPVLPMLLVNGSIGIGTGFSTDVPPFHPLQLVNQLRTRLRGEVETLAEVKLDPWWFGFKGRTMRQAASGVWTTHGNYVWDDAKQTVTITELPVGTWSKEYKEYLDGLLDPSDKAGAAAATEAPLRSFDDLYNDVDVKFVLYFDQNQYYGWKSDIPGFEKKFQLVNTHRSTNMVAFDANGGLRKFTNVGEILEHYYGARLGAYELRRQHQIGVLEAQHVETDARMRFIAAVLDERIVLARASDESIVAAIRRENLPPISEPTEPASIKAYEYLLRMRLDRLKASAVADLEKELAVLVEKIATLRLIKPDTMWLADLEEFETAWNAYASSRQIVMSAATSDGATAAPKKRKIAVKK